MDLEQLGAELRERRRTIRMSGTELARRVGISPTYVWLIERARQRPGGEPSRPSEDVLAAWTRTLRMSPEETQRMRELAGYDDPDEPTVPLARFSARLDSPALYDSMPRSDLRAESMAPEIAEVSSSTQIAPMAAEMPPIRPQPGTDPVETERRLVAATRRLVRQAEATGRVDELADLFTSMVEWLEHRLDRR